MKWVVICCMALMLLFVVVFSRALNPVPTFTERSCWMVVFNDGTAKFGWGQMSSGWAMGHGNFRDFGLPNGERWIWWEDKDKPIVETVRVPALDLREKPDDRGNTVTR